jgi:protein-tyrosine phosphatase
MKIIGPILIGISVYWAWWAAHTGGLGWLALWPALSFGAMGLAYLGLGARILGKRTDGSRPWPYLLLLGPYLLFGLVVWRLRALSSEPVSNLVAPGVRVGRLPRPGDLPESVTLVVDLTAEFTISRAVIGPRAYLCLPTLDGFIPAEEPLRELVRRASEHEGEMYVNCAYGHGRSALVAGAIMIARGQATSGEEATRLMKAARPGVSMSGAQRAMLDRLAAGPGRAGGPG